MSRKTNQSDYDDLVEGLIESVDSDFPGHIYTGKESEKLNICLPVPLAVSYLLQQEGFPLGRITTIVGEPGVSKSSFSAEIARWHRLQKGTSFMIDLEAKISPELLASIVNYDKKALIINNKLKTLTDWVNYLNTLINKCKEQVGTQIPICFIVDTVSSSLEDSEYKRIFEESDLSRSYPAEALFLTKYFKVLPKEILNFPYSVVLVNQLKFGNTPQGFPIRRIAGGAVIKFQESIEIQIDKVSSNNPDKLQRKKAKKKSPLSGETEIFDIYFVELKLSVYKNSTAPVSTIYVTKEWYTDYTFPICGETGKSYPQITRFNWDEALIDIFMEILSQRTVGAAKLKKLIDIESTHDNKFYYSHAIGITSSDAITKEELGIKLNEFINSNEELKSEVLAALNIRRRPLFYAGTDYNELMQSILGKIKDANL
ncbi:MAG: hypothetical protein QXK80_03685 [Candidatus Pacearchaeota archaeon]